MSQMSDRTNSGVKDAYLTCDYMMRILHTYLRCPSCDRYLMTGEESKKQVMMTDDLLSLVPAYNLPLCFATYHTSYKHCESACVT